MANARPNKMEDTGVPSEQRGPGATPIDPIIEETPHVPTEIVPPTIPSTVMTGIGSAIAQMEQMRSRAVTSAKYERRKDGSVWYVVKFANGDKQQKRVDDRNGNLPKGIDV